MQLIDLSNSEQVRKLLDMGQFFYDKDPEITNFCLEKIRALMEKEIGRVMVIDISEVRSEEWTKAWNKFLNKK